MQTMTRAMRWLRSLGNAGAVANAASASAVPASHDRVVEDLTARVDARLTAQRAAFTTAA